MRNMCRPFQPTEYWAIIQMAEKIEDLPTVSCWITAWSLWAGVMCVRGEIWCRTGEYWFVVGVWGGGG